MKHFCTIFDKGFLTRGLAVYGSLEKYVPDFHLWILCMDNESFDILTKLALPYLTPIRLNEVEDSELLRVKPTRTVNEYCWMMSSSFPLFLLETKALGMIAYLDADMLFFRGVEEIYSEFGNNSVMIIPHWYPDNNDPKMKLSGIYNVGMLIFRNDKNGLECLRRWKAQCVEWCYARYEDGKFGDQLYLNDWPEKIKGVHVLKNQGANIASWNIKGYAFFKKDNELWITVKSSGEEFPVIFYHYHGLKFFQTAFNAIKPYPVCILNKEIYRQCMSEIRQAYAIVRKIDPLWKFGFSPKLDILRRIKQTIILFLSDVK